MTQPITLKSVFIALLMMICCTAKAETVSYTDNGLTYTIDLEIQEATLSKYSGNAANVVIPEYVTYEGKGYKVTSLGDRCFYWCSFLVSVEIPSSVTSLGDMCFWGCSSLASIEIPSSVTSLGYACFLSCSSLTSIDIPSSVTSLGYQCFYYCRSLASIVIPSSVTNLGYACFAGCPSLETIVVDANNSRYDSREGCNAIIETTTNTMIAGCKNTFIPSSVTSLGDHCFTDCSSLVSISIPSSVTNLGYHCFWGCSSLVSVNIPSSVTSIGVGCFAACRFLEAIVVDANNPSYDSREGCDAIIETATNTMIAGCIDTFIPSSVTNLEDECFYGCRSLVSIEIPSSVTSLGYRCFFDCYFLASIDIPSSVTSLGGECFGYCSSLQTVTCRIKNVESGDFFDGTPIEEAILYVPKSLLTTYQSTYPWDSFGTVLPLEKELITINEEETYEVASTERYGKVTFNRSLVEGWNGLVLPFDMTVEDVKATFNAGKVKDFIGISYNEAKGVTLHFADFAAETTVIPAGRPFMVKAIAGTSYEIDDVILPATGLKNIEKTAEGYGNIKYVMKGTYAAETDLTDVNFALINGNNFFYHYAGRNASSAKAFRAYFENASENPAAARVSFAFDDEEGTTTAITEVGQPTKAESTYYDLQGRKVDSVKQKGIYIVNGRKVVK